MWKVLWSDISEISVFICIKKQLNIGMIKRNITEYSFPRKRMGECINMEDVVMQKTQRIYQNYPDIKHSDLFDCMETTARTHFVSIDDVIDAVLDFIEKGNPKCVNRTSMQGWSIDKYFPSQIFHVQDKNKTYCFLKDDVTILSQGKNPYTGKKLPERLTTFIKILAQRKQIFDPYGQTLPKGINEKCPIFTSSDPKVVYQYVCETPWSIIGHKSLSPGQKGSCIGKLNKITLKKDFTTMDIDSYGDVEIPTHEVESSEMVLNAVSLEPPRPKVKKKLRNPRGKTYKIYLPSEKITVTEKLQGVLALFMSEPGVVIPADAIKDIKKQKIRPDTPVTVYRGIGWNKPEPGTNSVSFKKWMKRQGRKKITLGDQLKMLDVRSTSWSSNICLASAFAVGYKKGIVMSYTAKPNEIIIDTRMLKNRSAYYHDDQAELILLPKERKVKLELLIWNNSQVTPTGMKLHQAPMSQYNLWVKELKI